MTLQMSGYRIISEMMWAGCLEGCLVQLTLLS